MAFLVCYSDSLAGHAHDKAIYLDQQFYEMIFRHCRDESSGFTLLRQVAMLRYKSPAILISTEQLAALTAELDELENANEHIRKYVNSKLSATMPHKTAPT